jgi:hypothetical protein
MEAQAVDGEMFAIVGDESGVVFKRRSRNHHVDQAEGSLP